MPDTPASTTKSNFGFLSQKVGPLPLWVWMATGIGVWYYLNKKNTASASASAVPNQQTDPAGNIGTIDPATGYVYGTPEDLAALAANNAGTGGGGGGGGGTGTPQTFSNNEAWGSAAESYLVSTGIDPTDASNAITTYLASQALTSAQQAMVNLAISILGPPPELPGPAQTSSSSTVPPGTTPATGTCPAGYTYSTTQTGAPGEIAASGGTGYCELTSESVPPPGITAPPPGKTPVPTAPKPVKPGAVSGFKATSVGSTSVALSWSPVSGATKYYLQVTYQTQTVASQTVTGTSATFSGLRADSTMNAHVTAQNAAGSGPTAQVGFHTSK